MNLTFDERLLITMQCSEIEIVWHADDRDLAQASENVCVAAKTHTHNFV